MEWRSAAVCLTDGLHTTQPPTPTQSRLWSNSPNWTSRVQTPSSSTSSPTTQVTVKFTHSTKSIKLHKETNNWNRIWRKQVLKYEYDFCLGSETQPLIPFGTLSLPMKLISDTESWEQLQKKKKRKIQVISVQKRMFKSERLAL